MTPADENIAAAEQFAAAQSKLAKDRFGNTIPTPEELRAYVDQVPQIYKDILATFQIASPNRSEGEPVAFGTLGRSLVNQGKTYTEYELELALGNLVDQSFLDESEFTQGYTPTRVGEALIATITGKRAKEVAVPALPSPNWAR
jgi:hypothetical protein